MGDKLLKLYDYAGKTGGLPMKMRLAVATGIPSPKAGETPDTPENIAKFRAAIKQITGKEAPPI